MKAVARSAGLLIALGGLACSDSQPFRPDPHAQAELIVKVTELSARSEEQEALRPAVKALYAAGSEDAALSLLRRVREGKAGLLLQLARYAALADRDDESVEFVRLALEAGASPEEDAPAGRLDEVVVEASQVASATASAAILEHLRLLSRSREPNPAAAAAMIVASGEIAVATENWDLLETVSSWVPFLTEDKARDSAYLALTWATAHRASATADKGHLNQGLIFAHAVSAAPKKAQAFALLAEAARGLNDVDLMQRMVERADTAMTGVSSHQEAVEGYCRVALAFRLGGPFARSLLESAMESERKAYVLSGMAPGGAGDLPQKETQALESMFGVFKARDFSQIANVALRLDQPAVAEMAFREASTTITTIDPGNVMVPVTIMAYLEAIEHLPDQQAQRSGLVVIQNYANGLQEPFVRAMILSSLGETAGDIAIDLKAPEFREVAWQALVSSPIREFREAQLADLSYASARLGDPRFVVDRMSQLVPRQSPDLELKVLAAALTGLAETERGLAETEPRFLVETRVSALED